MKVSIGIGGAASGCKRDFDEQVDYVVEAEKLGVDAVWSAEAWGQDAISPLEYVAARTSRIRLGTGFMQISARVPAMIAMTALSATDAQNVTSGCAAGTLMIGRRVSLRGAGHQVPPRSTSMCQSNHSGDLTSHPDPVIAEQYSSRDFVVSVCPLRLP